MNIQRENERTNEESEEGARHCHRTTLQTSSFLFMCYLEHFAAFLFFSIIFACLYAQIASFVNERFTSPATCCATFWSCFFFFAKLLVLFFLWMSTKRDEGESFFFAVPNCFRCFFYICTVKSSNGSYYTY